MPTLQRTSKEIEEMYYRHVDSVYRVCYSFMKNISETEDMVQETFLRMISDGKLFESEKHERAWLIITASNLCKDELKRHSRKNVSLEVVGDLSDPWSESNKDVLYAILHLPDKYKTVVFMYYYEGYSISEIAKYLHTMESTIRSRLLRARKLLKMKLGGEKCD